MTRASDYLKMAAAQLRRAVQTRQAEIGELRKEIDRKESDKRSRLNDLKKIEQMKAAEMAAVNDSSQRARMAQEISQLKGAEGDVQRQTEQIKSNLSQQISYGERQASAWAQQASQLEQSG